ncbi:MAG: hypothetical protein ABIJ09_11970 [Pseudomonadota bacterium]
MTETTTLSTVQVMMKKVSDGSHADRDLRRGFMTKHMIKGAAGGIRGADYLDHEAEFLDRRDSAASVNLRASDQERALAEKLMKLAAQGGAPAQAQTVKAMSSTVSAAIVDAVDTRQVVNVSAARAENERATPKEKLEDERVKRKLLLRDPEPVDDDFEDDEDEAAGEDDIEWVGPFADEGVDAALAASSLEQISRLIDDPEAEMRVYGTLRLLDPADMRAGLGSPLRVARHLRVIADRMLQSGQFSRDEVLQYLTGCFVNLGHEFGGSALRSFAFNVGISQIYPLEVLAHASRVLPDFLPRTTLAPFITGRKRRRLKAGKVATLTCDPSIKITGFALKGGGEPGYQFAPRSDPGEFALCVLTPGYFTLLLMGLDVHGLERIQEIRLAVEDQVTGEIPGEDPDLAEARQKAEARQQREDKKKAVASPAPPRKKKKKKKPPVFPG